MQITTGFSPSDVGEAEFYGFDFSRLLGSGETIVGATWICTLVNGTDASPSSRLSGSPILNGGITTQFVSGLLAGVTYSLQALVTTSAGQTLSLYAHVTCQALS